MRKVVVYQLLSLDGVAEEPGNWMFDVDEAVFDNLARVIEPQVAVLMGRLTYDYWVDYWPGSDVEPFASFINGTTKHVLTSRGLSQPWENSVVVDKPLVEYVRALKQQIHGDVGVHGSISVAQALLRAGLVDELRLVVAPTLAHRGRRLFDHQEALRRLELQSSDRTPTGNLLLTYRVGSESKR
jgi:dihydrofolate reductase